MLVWKAGNVCPSSACYCAMLVVVRVTILYRLTCVHFRCGGQGACVPTVHVTVL